MRGGPDRQHSYLAFYYPPPPLDLLNAPQFTRNKMFSARLINIIQSSLSSSHHVPLAFSSLTTLHQQYPVGNDAEPSVARQGYNTWDHPREPPYFIDWKNDDETREIYGGALPGPNQASPRLQPDAESWPDRVRAVSPHHICQYVRTSSYRAGTVSAEVSTDTKR